MCVIADFTNIEITKRDIIAFKEVRCRRLNDKRKLAISLFCPSNRMYQANHKCHTLGASLIYPFGKLKESNLDETPGFYCYESWSGFHPLSFISVRIPAGTRIVRGRYEGKRTINAEKIIPLDWTL